MRTRRIELWRDDSERGPPTTDRFQAGSFKTYSPDAKDESVRTFSAIVNSTERGRVFSMLFHHGWHRCYALNSRASELRCTSSRPTRYEARRTSYEAADSDCSSSVCSDSSVSLHLPGDATEITDEDDAIKFRRAFELFDQNCDGVISAQELGAVMCTLGYKVSDVEVEDMVAEAGTSGKGSVDFEEFLAMLTQKAETRRKGSLGEIELLFRAFDRDRHGHITAEDLRHVMSSINESVTDKELEAMMLAADADGDGLISYEEFAAILSPELVAGEQG